MCGLTYEGEQEQQDRRGDLVLRQILEVPKPANATTTTLDEQLKRYKCPRATGEHTASAHRRRMASTSSTPHRQVSTASPAMGIFRRRS